MPVVAQSAEEFIPNFQEYTIRQRIPNYVYKSSLKLENSDSINLRLYAKMQTEFSKQINENEVLAAYENKYILDEKLNLSLNALLDMMPEKMSLEITQDASVYYKILKDSYQIFFEYFLIDEFDGADEAIFTVYLDNNRILNYGGDLTDSVSQLNKLLINQFATEFA